MSLKKAYLYLVSVISLVIWVVGAIMLINIGVKTFIFPNADRDMYGSYPCPVGYDMQGRPVPCDTETESQYKKEAQDRQKAQKQRDAAQALSMILVSCPVWFVHWRLAKKEV